MKNLLIYVNPRHDFDQEYNNRQMIETQIESSLIFWKPEDIMLVTNFPYQYRGVKAMVVNDNLFCEADAKASKVTVIIHLLERGLLPELTWFHDLDAFQTAPINIKLEHDLGLTNYGYKISWNTGSIFFKPTALDVFVLLRDEVYKRKANEEPVLWILTKYNVNNINSRYEILDSTYNVGMTRTDEVLAVASKPIHVVHFPPHQQNTFERFKPIMTTDLTKIIANKYSYPLV